MPNTEEIAGMTRSFQGRCLNLQRKAFMDYQEREISPELRERAVKMQKLVAAQDYAAAAKEIDAIVYLCKILMIQSYVTPTNFESIASDGVALSVILKDIAENGELKD